MRLLTATLLLVLLVPAGAVKAQTKADSISLFFPKVLITDSSNRVLLVYDANRKAYEIPSIGTMAGPSSIKDYIQKTAEEIGITYRGFRLGGMFTYIFPDKYRTFIRPYFVVQSNGYANGTGLADTTCHWFTREEAIALIPYPASALIVRQLLEKPAITWGGSFEEYGYTNPVDTSKIVFRQLEHFYPLN
ncbi:hypothetical protein HNQ91_001728 [Filimonas zeae]|uniref:NUDIX hydrolase n=1 Tax=Filimonas zeae TaxID=1737353 RepID=A0A917IWZ1_9BACT|nr:NUDIX hydrolase [Filimonas zeae]MDR6338677.1 hypothetical protein [Filimonas zeae]GGH67099.1 hypothetical protein GCM10011379_22000 [Filimonas zeae]